MRKGILILDYGKEVKNIKIYGNTIVLTDEIFELALHNNPYFNALTVPKKPEGNINHFENVKLSEASLQRLYNDNILKARIPVPPIEEQERIVDILDRFDALCTDISAGLPAEIEARKKQYEYYRDKLLTFKEASE